VDPFLKHTSRNDCKLAARRLGRLMMAAVDDGKNLVSMVSAHCTGNRSIAKRRYVMRTAGNYDKPEKMGLFFHEAKSAPGKNI